MFNHASGTPKASVSLPVLVINLSIILSPAGVFAPPGADPASSILTSPLT